MGGLFCVGIASAQPPEPAPGQETEIPWAETHNLLQGELTSHWNHFSAVEKTQLPSVWKRVGGADLEQAELICTGNPRGYLYTSRQFNEFELTFEWRFVSDPNGNSGILIFTQNDRRLWPTCIQVQLHQPVAGSVFPNGDAVTDAPVKKEGLARPVGEWNECRIISRNGRLLVHVNGTRAGEVAGCNPTTGRIGIQSEGSEVHFRRLIVRTPAEPAETENAARDEQESSDPKAPTPPRSAS